MLTCDPVEQSDLNNIIISGGFGNMNSYGNGTQFNNETQMLNELLDVGHHKYDLRGYKAAHNLASNCLDKGVLPWVEMIQNLDTIGFIKRPKPKGSTTTNSR